MTELLNIIKTEQILLTWISLFFIGVCSVKITNLEVPEIIKNGTESQVTLDCDYSYSRSEDVGLVVKWYLNSDPEPVYQWIPPQDPQALGILRDRLNLNFRASIDPYTMYRALNILHPTTELSGEYMCKVSSFDTEDSVAKKMTVYAPPSVVSIRPFKPTEDSVNITCTAEGIHPIPDVIMIYYSVSRRTRVRVYGLDPVYDYEDGSYNVSVSKNFEDESLAGETIFECEFLIAEANYSNTKTLRYLPGTRSSSLSKPSLSSAHGISFYNNGGSVVRFPMVAIFLLALSVMIYKSTTAL